MADRSRKRSAGITAAAMTFGLLAATLPLGAAAQGDAETAAECAQSTAENAMQMWERTGGNKGMVGWTQIGFPGARADFMDWVERNEPYPFPAVSIRGERA